MRHIETTLVGLAFAATAACGGSAPGTTAQDDPKPEAPLASQSVDHADVAPLKDAGRATYVVTSVTGFGAYCVDLPAAVFGEVGETVTADFSDDGAYLYQDKHVSFDFFDFRTGTHKQSNLGGSVDTTHGHYESSDEFKFVDDQSPGGEGSKSAFYYSMTITRSGDTLELDYKIPNPAGDVSCVLTRSGS